MAPNTIRTRLIDVLQVLRLPHQASHGPVEMRQQLLSDRPLVIQRFQMAARRVEPDQGGRQIDECDPVLASHLECGRGTESDRFRPVRGDVAAAADLGNRPGPGGVGR